MGIGVRSVKSLEEGIKDLAIFGIYESTKREQITINNQQWTKFDIPNVEEIIVHFENGKIYVVHTSNNRELLNEMASTFQFTK